VPCLLPYLNEYHVFVPGLCLRYSIPFLLHFSAHLEPWNFAYSTQDSILLQCTRRLAHHVWHSRLICRHTPLVYHSHSSSFTSLLHSQHSYRCLTFLHKVYFFRANPTDLHFAPQIPNASSPSQDTINKLAHVAGICKQYNAMLHVML
jgi:hypothetical protein